MLNAANETLQYHQRNLESAKSEFAEAIGKLKDSHATIDHWQLQAAKFAAQIEAAKAQIQQSIDQGRADLEQQYEEKYLVRFKREAQKHRHQEAAIVVAFDLKAQEHAAQLGEVMGKYEQLLNEYQAVLDSYHPELSEIKALFEQQMISVEEERDRLYGQLARYHDAKTFSGSTRADINGNRLIDYFLNPLRGIICDAERCESHFEYDEIWVRPRNATVEQFEKFKSDVHRQLSFNRLFVLVNKLNVHYENAWKDCCLCLLSLYRWIVSFNRLVVRKFGQLINRLVVRWLSYRKPISTQRTTRHKVVSSRQSIA